MLKEALEHLVRGLVSAPDRVRVREYNNRRGQNLEVQVASDDVGKVIGRQGRTAQALRTVINALTDNHVRVDFTDRRQRRSR
ncbi:MAG: RNA-binding protein [Propionibacteriaceae bacterium]|jgi:predicted RNA-binding protein YlqC (UPF0109 family)|nr:RNA-binding protein [Propionibacteriaceae bacterium]